MERSKYNPALMFGVSEEDETSAVCTSKAAASSCDEASGSFSGSVSGSGPEDQAGESQHIFRRSYSEMHRNRSRQFFRSLYFKRRQFRLSQAQSQPYENETSNSAAASTNQEEPARPIEPLRTDSAAVNRVDIRFNITDSIDESEEINLDLHLAESFNAKSDTETLGASLSQLHTLNVGGRTLTTSHSAPLNEVRSSASPSDVEEAHSLLSAGSPTLNQPLVSAGWPRQPAATNATRKVEQLAIEPQVTKRNRSTSYGGIEAPVTALTILSNRSASPQSDLARAMDTERPMNKLQASLSVANESRSLTTLQAAFIPVSRANTNAAQLTNTTNQQYRSRRQRGSRASSIMSNNSSAITAATQYDSPTGSTRTSAAASTINRTRKFSAISYNSAFESGLKSSIYLERMHRKSSPKSPLSPPPTVGTSMVTVPTGSTYAKSLTNLVFPSPAGQTTSNENNIQRNCLTPEVHASRSSNQLSVSPPRKMACSSIGGARSLMRASSGRSKAIHITNAQDLSVNFTPQCAAHTTDCGNTYAALARSDTGATRIMQTQAVQSYGCSHSRSRSRPRSHTASSCASRKTSDDCAKIAQQHNDSLINDLASENEITHHAQNKRETSPSSSSVNRVDEQQFASLARLLVTRDLKSAIQKARSINLISDIKQSTANISSCLRLRGPESKAPFSPARLSPTNSSPCDGRKPPAESARSGVGLRVTHQLSAESYATATSTTSRAPDDRSRSRDTRYTLQPPDALPADTLGLMDSLDRSSLCSNNKLGRDSITLTSASQNSFSRRPHLGHRFEHEHEHDPDGEVAKHEDPPACEFDALLNESRTGMPTGTRSSPHLSLGLGFGLCSSALESKRPSALAREKTFALDSCGSNKYTVAYRLGVRKRLFRKRQIVADLTLVFALVGIFLMVVENETTVQRVKRFTDDRNHADADNLGGAGSMSMSMSMAMPSQRETRDGSGSPSPRNSSKRRSEDKPDFSAFENDTCYKRRQAIGRAVLEAVLPYKMGRESFMIKVAISLSTLMVEILIVVYQVYEIRVYCVDNCVLDWRLAMSLNRMTQIAFELLICAIHPFPFFDSSQLICVAFLPPISTIPVSSYVPLDILYGLPMVFRAYLIVRVLVLHSRLLTDASSRSIGALNRITFNTTFVFKTFMTNRPGITLTVFIMMLWFINSWIIRVCESFHNDQFHVYNNAIWHTAVTFFSIGYGDVVPITYWGRAISISTGLFGAGSTAFVVAVVARKLELTRAEKHVHNFMTDSQLTKELKCAAANVIRETWLIFKSSRYAKRKQSVSVRVRMHQRKLLDAIQRLRQIKLKQRKLTDSANALIDVVKLHNDLGDTIEEARESQSRVSQRIDGLEEKLKVLQQTIDSLPDVLLEKLNSVAAGRSGALLLNRSVSNYDFPNAPKQNAVSHGEPASEHQRAQDDVRRVSNSGVSLTSANMWFSHNSRN